MDPLNKFDVFFFLATLVVVVISGTRYYGITHGPPIIEPLYPVSTHITPLTPLPELEEPDYEPVNPPAPIEVYNEIPASEITCLSLMSGVVCQN